MKHFRCTLIVNGVDVRTFVFEAESHWHAFHKVKGIPKDHLNWKVRVDQIDESEAQAELARMLLLLKDRENPNK